MLNSIQKEKLKVALESIKVAKEQGIKWHVEERAQTKDKHEGK